MPSSLGLAAIRLGGGGRCDRCVRLLTRSLQLLLDSSPACHCSLKSSATKRNRCKRSAESCGCEVAAAQLVRARHTRTPHRGPAGVVPLGPQCPAGRWLSRPPARTESRHLALGPVSPSRLPLELCLQLWHAVAKLFGQLLLLWCHPRHSAAVTSSQSQANSVVPT